LAAVISPYGGTNEGFSQGALRLLGTEYERQDDAPATDEVLVAVRKVSALALQIGEVVVAESNTSNGIGAPVDPCVPPVTREWACSELRESQVRILP
jgi:hypothetical protein